MTRGRRRDRTALHGLASMMAVAAVFIGADAVAAGARARAFAADAPAESSQPAPAARSSPGQRRRRWAGTAGTRSARRSPRRRRRSRPTSWRSSCCRTAGSILTVDIQWYEPGASGHDYRPDAPLVMDEWGRLLPAPNRFPSAADGAGFKPLADYVHAQGPAVRHPPDARHSAAGGRAEAAGQGNGACTAADIADRASICPWNPDMYGVDMTKPGAQAYYDSVFELIASWGVDFVKVDDISRPYHEHEREIEAIRRAIDRTGRPMVLSLSPGETALDAAEHVKRHANMWRISDDFWDTWPALLEQFGAARALEPAPGPGPLAGRGHAAARRARPRPAHDALHPRRAAHADDAVVDRALAADPRRRHDEDGRRHARAADERRGDRGRPGTARATGRCSTATASSPGPPSVPGSPDRYVALFNTRDRGANEAASTPGGASTATGLPITVSLAELGIVRSLPGAGPLDARGSAAGRSRSGRGRAVARRGALPAHARAVAHRNFGIAREQYTKLRLVHMLARKRR